MKPVVHILILFLTLAWYANPCSAQNKSVQLSGKKTVNLTTSEDSGFDWMTTSRRKLMGQLPTITISGTVLDEFNKPAKNVWVYALGKDYSEHDSKRTDSLGNFTMTIHTEDSIIVLANPGKRQRYRNIFSVYQAPLNLSIQLSAEVFFSAGQIFNSIEDVLVSRKNTRMVSEITICRSRHTFQMIYPFKNGNITTIYAYQIEDRYR